jgi:hypothetical protein
MTTSSLHSFGFLDGLAAASGVPVFILLVSLIREPARRKFMAILVAGAGAAYFDGGLGPWELVFTAVLTWVAFRGLDDYRFIGAAWLLHAGWDVLHHLYGRPILYFAPTSSGGCAVFDALLALWFFAGAPSPLRRVAGIASGVRS